MGSPYPAMSKSAERAPPSWGGRGNPYFCEIDQFKFDLTQYVRQDKFLVSKPVFLQFIFFWGGVYG